MAPQLVVPREQLLERANQLRSDTLQYPVQPASGAAAIGAAGPVGVVAPPPTGVPFGPPAPLPSAAPPATPSLQLGPPIVSPPLR
jgi:hypothetical protein